MVFRVTSLEDTEQEAIAEQVKKDLKARPTRPRLRHVPRLGRSAGGWRSPRRTTSTLSSARRPTLQRTP
jgi:hypothetical protein